MTREEELEEPDHVHSRPDPSSDGEYINSLSILSLIYPSF